VILEIRHFPLFLIKFKPNLMSENHGHHEDHGHAEDGGPVSSWKFEVPLALGAFFWALVIVIVNVTCSNCDENCCEDGKSCAPTEAHSGGGGHH
jgi:hypothetical protein